MTHLYHFPPPCQQGQRGPTTPITQRLTAITRNRFSLIRFRSPLLTESRLLSLPDGTEMFHFPSFPPTTLYIQVEVTGHISSRVSPFGNPRITARLPTPRGLSQAPTSFIGSWCQGIHRAPLKTFTTTHTRSCTDTKMLASTVQFSSYGQKQPTPNAQPHTPKGTRLVRLEGRIPHPPHHPRKDNETNARRVNTRRTRKLIPYAHSLRTQQRAQDHPTPAASRSITNPERL